MQAAMNATMSAVELLRIDVIDTIRSSRRLQTATQIAERCQLSERSDRIRVCLHALEKVDWARFRASGHWVLTRLAPELSPEQKSQVDRAAKTMRRHLTSTRQASGIFADIPQEEVRAVKEKRPDPLRAYRLGHASIRL